jgi:hypothetical protein
MAHLWGHARSSGFELYDNRYENKPFCNDASAPNINYIRNKQHEYPIFNSSANFASSLITQHSMPMNDSYGQTYSSSYNYFDPLCVNYFGIVEQENLSLNSSATISKPTTIQSYADE